LQSASEAVGKQAPPRPALAKNTMRTQSRRLDMQRARAGTRRRASRVIVGINSSFQGSALRISKALRASGRLRRRPPEDRIGSRLQQRRAVLTGGVRVSLVGLCIELDLNRQLDAR
jgi:hypothetical protein